MARFLGLLSLLLLLGSISMAQDYPKRLHYFGDVTARSETGSSKSFHLDLYLWIESAATPLDAVVAGESHLAPSVAPGEVIPIRSIRVSNGRLAPANGVEGAGFTGGLEGAWGTPLTLAFDRLKYGGHTYVGGGSLGMTAVPVPSPSKPSPPPAPLMAASPLAQIGPPPDQPWDHLSVGGVRPGMNRLQAESIASKQTPTPKLERFSSTGILERVTGGSLELDHKLILALGSRFSAAGLVLGNAQRGLSSGHPGQLTMASQWEYICGVVTVVARSDDPLVNDGSVTSVTLDSRARIPFALYGRVVDPDGFPLEGASVELSCFGPSRTLEVVTSGKEGRYQFQHACDYGINYAIGANYPGYVPNGTSTTFYRPYWESAPKPPGPLEIKLRK